MFGRSQQLLLPQPASAFQPIDYEQAAAKLDEKFHSSLSHYDRDKVQLPPLQPGEAVFVQCGKTKRWEKKGEILEKRPNGLSYLVDIDGRVAIRSRAFLKPVFKEGQGGAQDHVSRNQDQRDFHSLSTPPLRLSSRLQEKKEEKCFPSSCALDPAIPTRKSSVSLSACSSCTDRTPRRPRTPSINRWGDFPSSIYNGPPLPLGQRRSSIAPCSSLPSCSLLDPLPQHLPQPGPSWLTARPPSFLLLFRLIARPLARDQDCSWQGRTSKEASAFQACLSLPRSDQVDADPLRLDLCSQGQCSFPGSSPLSSRPSCTMVDTTTTPSANVASRVVVGSPFSTAPATIMTDGRNQAASPS